ncbi:MAG TPA: GGDEF domain-containing protein [bacterium]|nr:GGDEF domain-containing protein [bacterium]
MNWKRICSEFLEIGVNNDYLQKRMDDFRNMSVVMFILGAPFAAGLWEWDYFRDPVGAEQTFLLRLAFFPIFIGVAMVMYRIKDYRLVGIFSVIAMLVTEVFLIQIFERLESGVIYGIGGFMFYFLVSLIGFLGLPLRLTIPYAIAITAFPHLFAFFGYFGGFQHVNFATLIWPAAVLTILGHIAATHNYRKRYEFEISLELATKTDPMTGAVNRRGFMPLLEQEFFRHRRIGHSLALLMMDIDHFKSINDTYGHPTGDQVIRMLANTCEKFSRQTDTVARLGGEEFAVLMPHTEKNMAVMLAERIRIGVEECSQVSDSGIPFRYTVSIGISECQPDDETFDQLIARADTALYRAKTQGRNRVIVSGDFDES